MQTHDFLFNPVCQTTTMKDESFLKYVAITEQQTKPTDESIVASIKEKFFEYATKNNTPKERITEIWDFVEPKLVKNEGLARFTLDYAGAESSYFFPWLINVFKSPSTALEMAYGAGEDLFGNWDECLIGTNDPIEFFVENDPTFVYNRERQLYTAELATRFQEAALLDNKKTKIVDFGAGRLAWARWHGYDFDYAVQDIYAFDRDSTVNPETLFDSPLEELGIHYEHGDLSAQLDNPNCKNANLVILSGVVSYLPAETFSNLVMPKIHTLLVNGGAFFFDLQLDCPYLRRSVKLWDWPELKLFSDIPSAISFVEDIREKLWSNGKKFSAEYMVDTYNSSPSGLMITMLKIQ